MTTIPRSEQLALDELALKDWMTDLSEAPSILEAHYQRYMHIDYIHLQSVYMWIHGPMSMYQWPGAPHGTVHMLEDVPPPWNPTLQDVEDIITLGVSRRGLSMNGKIIQILQYRGRYNVDLNSPLLGEHITYIYSLCNEFERQLQSGVVFRSASSHFQLDTDEDEDEDDGEDDLIEPAESPYTEEEWRVLNVSVSTCFPTINNLCSEGVNILDRIMDTDTRELNEGDYLKLMNLFRDLHT